MKLESLMGEYVSSIHCSWLVIHHEITNTMDLPAGSPGGSPALIRWISVGWISRSPSDSLPLVDAREWCCWFPGNS